MTDSYPALRYWQEKLLDGQLPRQRPHRYLTFDIDTGGLNNIRLVIEYAAVLAAFTGRTLVLPPPCSWYLINHGPIPGGEPGGMTDIGDVFDIDALCQAMPVLTTQAFIDEAQVHLSIPAGFGQPGYFDSGDDPFQTRWRQWLLQNSVIPGWNPFDTLICLPDVNSVTRAGTLDLRYVDGRELVELSPVMQAAPVLHLPSDHQYRSLGPVATMLAANEPQVPVLGRRILKHHLKYRPEIFDIAEKIAKIIHPCGYDAVHVRRNDFQYKETRLAAADVARNTRPLFDPTTPLYVATDENDPEFFASLASGFGDKPILRWQDIAAQHPEPVSDLWLGPVEQLICAAADNFAGTDLSTFSSYIHRLRGYIAPEHHINHYHGVDHSQPVTAHDAFQYGGREYLRENPLFWLSC